MKLILMVGVLGVALSGDFKSTDAGVALQLLVKILIMSVQMYVMFIFLKHFQLFVSKK